MSMNPVYVASKGSINHDGNITNKIYQNTNISSRGTQYRTLSSPGHSVLMQSAFIISSLISLVLVICFLWMRWREYRARIYEVRHVRQTSGDNTINEEVEKRLRRKILEILPTKKFVPLDNTEASRGCPICLEPFQVDEEICWSHNADCSHVFHTTCIVEWLVKNDLRQCPMCRSFFLIEKEKQEHSCRTQSQ